MTSEEFEFLLFDRIEKIKQINEEYDLENNAYISFSGGKDSTVLHFLIDLALPNNKIPRVYINTGIEYQDIRKFVVEMAKNDERIIIVNSGVNIKKMLEEEGYPFKSKEHSLKVNCYKKGSRANNVMKYKEGNGKFSCPKSLLYQYEEEFTLNISNKCCYKLKKDIIHRWERENKKPITMTGMRNEEGGQRSNLGCIIAKADKVIKFHPLMPLKEEWLDEFIKKYNIQLCRLYYPPFNLERTGCKGCPFNKYLQKDLDMMRELLPKEYKQCETIWKPVYDEYRRIGYRLRKDTGQLTIFDFIESE